MNKRDQVETDVEAVAADVAGRLQHRGIETGDDERPEDLAELLSAVERFEAAVQTHGGDLMMDDLKSSEPDDPHFVLPQRPPGEPVPAYIARIDAATAGLASHPPQPD